MPVTAKLKGAFKGLKGIVSKGYEAFIGVSPGGEEFTSKLNKMLHQVRPNSVLPDFCHGTLRDIFRGQLIKSKPLFLYLSGDDHTSKHFETQILTMPEIIVLMVSFTTLIDFRMTTLCALASTQPLMMANPLKDISNSK